MVNPTIIGQDELPIEVCALSTKNVIELFLEDAENIMDILNAKPNPTECIVLILFPFCFLPSFFPNAHFIFVISPFFVIIVFKQGESDHANFKEELEHIPLL